MSNEIDLVPTDYRRVAQLRRWLRVFALVYLGVVLSLGAAKASLTYAVREKGREVERLEAAKKQARSQQLRLQALARERRHAQQRMQVLSGLRGGVAVKEMFLAVDQALDGHVWFLDWKFRRAGELVENNPEAVNTGYFIVVPIEQESEREKAWRVQTHMEIRAQAADHAALANFVRRLLDQPRIEKVRVLNTQIHRYTSQEVVDFELAVVVKTQA